MLYVFPDMTNCVEAFTILSLWANHINIPEFLGDHPYVFPGGMVSNDVKGDIIPRGMLNIQTFA